MLILLLYINVSFEYSDFQNNIFKLNIRTRHLTLHDELQIVIWNELTWIKDNSLTKMFIWVINIFKRVWETELTPFMLSRIFEYSYENACLTQTYRWSKKGVSLNLDLPSETKLYNDVRYICFKYFLDTENISG